MYPVGTEHIRDGLCISANNQSAKTAWFTFTFELGCQCLSFRAHNSAHCGLDSPNQFKLIVAIIVFEYKLHALVTLEAVCEGDWGLEIRIEIVVDSFCLADFDPRFSTLIELVNATDRVRLAEDIEVF